jgi:hypothetical protein
LVIIQMTEVNQKHRSVRLITTGQEKFIMKCKMRNQVVSFGQVWIKILNVLISKIGIFSCHIIVCKMKLMYLNLRTGTVNQSKKSLIKIQIQDNINPTTD